MSAPRRDPAGRAAGAKLAADDARDGGERDGGDRGHGSGWDVAADVAKDPALIPDPAVTEVPGALREEIEAAMARYPDPHSAAIPALHAAQRLHGWCSPAAIEQVACVMRVTPAYLASIASFYDMLEMAPVGRHDVYVCTNISCSLRGADALLAAVREAAAGNPLALVELPTALRSENPLPETLMPELLPLTERLERVFAARVAERVVVLESGRVAWTGTMAELQEDEGARRAYLAV